MKRFLSGDFAAAGLLGLLTIVLFADVIFLGNGFFIRDLTSYHYPMKQIVRETIARGEFPYWNPFYSAGQPMAANPAYEVFYPPQWLIFLPDYHLGFQLHILLHLFMAGWGMHVLLRSLRLDRRAALLGSLSLLLSGFLLSLVNLLPSLFSFAWLPWIAYFFRRLLLFLRLRDFAASSLILGLQFLVGEPATTGQSLFLIASYAAWRAWRARSRRKLGRSAALLVLVCLGGAAIAAVQLIPAVDFFRDTIRATGFDFDISTRWSMSPQRPLELLFPRYFGSMAENGSRFWGGVLYGRELSPYLFSIYAGLAAVVLVLTGLILRSRGSLLLAWIGAVSFFLAVGKHTPVFGVLHEWGVVDSLRYPERFALSGLFAMVVFAAVIFHRVLRGERRVLLVAVGVAAGLALVATIAGLFTLRPNYLEEFRAHWDLSPTPLTWFLAQSNRQQWWLAAIRAAVLAALLLWRLKSGHRWWDATILLFLLIDLGPMSNTILPRMPREFFSAPEMARRLPPDREKYRIFHLAEWLDETSVARKYNRRTGLSLFWVIRNGMFPQTPSRWGYRTVLEIGVDGTMLTTTQALTDLFSRASRLRPDDWFERYAAISNARLRTLYRPFEQELIRTRGNLEEIKPVVFIQGPDYPRYYFADRLQTIDSPEDFVRNLTSDGFTPRTALVYFPSFSPASGRVLSARESQNQARLLVQSSGRGFLVASVSFHQYWRATLDGRPTSIHRVNLAYQGIVIPPGRHEVQFRYRNPLVFPSLAISALSTLLMLAGIFRRISPHPSQAPSDPRDIEQHSQ